MKTKTKRRTHKSYRINWDEQENIICSYLCDYGFHGQTIALHTGLSLSQVYYRLSKIGKKLRDYRNGETSPARIILQRYNIQSITSSNMQKIRKNTITLANF